VRVVFLGGTRFVGPVAIRHLRDAGHEVAVAHSGAHEPSVLVDIEHLHGTRKELLAIDGPVQSWRPDAVVDTFAGGATAEKAAALASCATRAGAGHIVAVSSMDVYQYCVDAGLGDGSGVIALPHQPLPLDETAPLRRGPYPGGSAEHDNVAMEAALHDCGRVTVLRPGAIYGPHPEVREWFLVERICRGERRLELPDGGAQFWHHIEIAQDAGSDEVLTLEEAAALLRLPIEAVRARAIAGHLPGRAFGDEWRFSRAALMAWLADGEAAPHETQLPAKRNDG
jgi:excisionase family DNA binding protein